MIIRKHTLIPFILSLASSASADVPHGIRNIGEGPCEYYAFKWKLP